MEKRAEPRQMRSRRAAEIQDQAINVIEGWYSQVCTKSKGRMMPQKMEKTARKAQKLGMTTRQACNNKRNQELQELLEPLLISYKTTRYSYSAKMDAVVKNELPTKMHR